MPDDIKLNSFIGCIRGKALCLLLGGVFLTGCAPSHILHYQEDTSRDYTYIDFSRNSEPFKISSEVGGEHISYVKVLGFEGDTFSVALTSQYDEVMLNISGDGIYVYSDNSRDFNQYRVKIEEKEAIFSVALSAHPYGEYILNIKKL